MTLGKKLALQRKALGLTEEEVALKIRVTTKEVIDWENNIGEPSIQNLKDLSMLFNISIDDLLDTGMGDDDVAIGYCKNCGIAINERNLGSKTPIVLCRRCVEVNKAQIRREEIKKKAIAERKEKAQRAKRIAEYNAFKERQKAILKKQGISFLVALIPTLLWLGFHLYTQQQNPDNTWAIVGYVLTYCIFSFVSLLFYDGPVRDLLIYMCTASIKWPGMVYTFDMDGFLWVIAMKALFMLLGFIFGILCGILGIVLGLIVAPFVFPYKLIKMFYDLHHADLTDYVS